VTTRDAFEKALQANRYDIKTRGVYADWLEENGHTDEAHRQRNMATEEWVKTHKQLMCLPNEENRVRLQVAFERWLTKFGMRVECGLTTHLSLGYLDKQTSLAIAVRLGDKSYARIFSDYDPLWDDSFLALVCRQVLMAFLDDEGK